MYRFAGRLFNMFYSVYDKLSDPNKDANNKGTQERYVEVIEAELDEELLPYLDNLQTDVIVPKTALDKFIPYIESVNGYDVDWFLTTQPIAFRRNVASKWKKITGILCTTKAYTVMGLWWNMQIDFIADNSNNGGFDSDTTLDSPLRTFDSGCPNCSNYSIEVLSTERWQDVIDALVFILEVNQEINAVLTGIKFNSDDLLTLNPSLGDLFSESFKKSF